MTTSLRSSDRGFLVGGATLLAVAMGVGRFAYTPLLPLMERDAGLTVAVAGQLAVFNLFGYLIGAALAMTPYSHRRRLAITRYAVASVIVTTGLMATTSLPQLWLVLRVMTGISSGFVLVFASSIVLERASSRREPAWPPLFFSGVGIGIAFTGVAVPFFTSLGGSRAAWIGLAVCSAVAIGLTLRAFTDEATETRFVVSPIEQELPSDRVTYRWLLAVYTCEAFAYIVPATFLVTLVDRNASLARFAGLTWVLVGCAAAVATFPWISVGKRFGKARALALGLALQSVGILAASISDSAVAVFISALTLGGTFIAITFFASGLARDIFPRRTSAAISRLTVLYSCGQILGPLLATHVALQFGSYRIAFACAGGIAAAAAAVTSFAIHDPLQGPAPALPSSGS